jgi:hypothetical protein
LDLHSGGAEAPLGALRAPIFQSLDLEVAGAAEEDGALP